MGPGPSPLDMSLTFAGREKEIGRLLSLLAQRRNVLVSGPAGIGKTALLNQVRSRAPLLYCEDTSKLSRICDALERHFGWNHSRLNIIERKNRILAYVEKRGQPIAFDHVAHIPPRIARFMAHLSRHVPVWIACRSEAPADIGRIWEYLSGFIRFPVSPLDKAGVRQLVTQAVSNRAIQPDALGHIEVLHRLSHGNPRLLEELFIELAARKYKIETSFGRCLLDLDRRIQELKTNLAPPADETRSRQDQAQRGSLAHAPHPGP